MTSAEYVARALDRLRRAERCAHAEAGRCQAGDTSTAAAALISLRWQIVDSIDDLATAQAVQP